MIISILGCLGSGKTTIINRMIDRYKIPGFKMSWMPEFLSMNGKAITYDQDERIAISALVSVAKSYIEAGHNFVLISDFRYTALSELMGRLNVINHRMIVLSFKDYKIIENRLDARVSGYKNINEAIASNEKFRSLDGDKYIHISVDGQNVDDICDNIYMKIN